MNQPQLKVFISHATVDTWVARQMADHIHRCGHTTFLDQVNLSHGDDFEQEILRQADESSELLVLFTPWALDRRYLWLEIGVFWGARKRIVGVLYGLTAKELIADEKTPVAIKRLLLLEINQIDSYFLQLQNRSIQKESTNE